jgi:FkbM family methyltransferase
MAGTLYSRLYAAATSIAKALRMHRWPLIGPLLWAGGRKVSARIHPSVLHVDGHDLRVGADDPLGLGTRGRYEPLLHQLLGDRLTAGGCFVDGGAHIGYHTLAAARAVGPSGRVLAFEPSPATFRLLVENVERNGYRQVECVEAALSGRSGSGTLNLSDENSGDHRILDAGESRHSVEIRLHRLDEYLPEGQQVDLVKLDVQGAEPLVLDGMAGLFESNRPRALALEYSPSMWSPETSAEDLLQLLREQFGVIYDVNEGARSMEPVSDDWLLATYTRENGRFTNLLCEKA